MANAAGYEDLSDVWMTAQKYGFTTSLSCVFVSRPYGAESSFHTVQEEMIAEFTKWLDDPAREGFYDIPEGYSREDKKVWLEVYLTDPNVAVEFKLRFR
ncbi:MAG: hypothetical protein EOP83_09990 [Verrucomicrobiaceae bacterium]|nr:MAG: hypothetical protein EOP83_09990 [Verrucomicrobiaceae bacterium]